MIKRRNSPYDNNILSRNPPDEKINIKRSLSVNKVDDVLCADLPAARLPWTISWRYFPLLRMRTRRRIAVIAQEKRFCVSMMML